MAVLVAVFWVLSRTHQICSEVSKSRETYDGASVDIDILEKGLIRTHLFLARPKIVTVDSTSIAA
jgi:hypothetical protein